MWCEWTCCCSVVPGFFWRRILRQPIGLGGAVGGAILRTNFFFGTICWWQLQAGPDTLPLLCCITDSQTPLLLDEHHTQTHTHAEGRDGFGWQFSSLRAQRADTRLMEPLHLDVNTGKLIPFVSLMSEIKQHVVEDCCKTTSLLANIPFFWLRYQMYCITAEFWFNSSTPLHCKSEPFPLFWPGKGVVAICL